MRRKKLYRAAGLLVSAAGLFTAVYVLFFIPPSRPNLIFISIDTLRADHLGVYGAQAATSPNIDKFAKESFVFREAYVPRGSTAPSLASALTGLYPSHHGVLRNDCLLPPEICTLPRLLSKAGYETTAITSNWIVQKTRLHRDFERSRCTAKEGLPQSTWDEESVKAALEFLAKAQGRQEPFFLWVHLMDPHSPYQAAPKDRGRFAKHTLGLDGSREQLTEITQGISFFDKEDREEICALYDEEVFGSDRRAGKILDAVEELGLEDNTIVILFADHGEELADHKRYFFHAVSVYRPVLHVPFVWHVPGRFLEEKSPRDLQGDSNIPVSVVDIAPTLSSMAGVSFPGNLDGTDLMPVFQGGDISRKAVFTEYVDKICGVITGKFHYIYNPDGFCPAGGPFPTSKEWRGNRELSRRLRTRPVFTVRREELYDIESDHTEQKNLAEQKESVSARLKEKVLEYLSGRDFREPHVIKNEQLRIRLENLGYL